MEVVREILASHESGISRDGLLAWARLRGDPKMTDEDLEAALAAMGDEVVDVQGFLYLRRFAPQGSTASTGPQPLPPPPAPWATEPGASGGTPASPDGAAWPPPAQSAWGSPEQAGPPPAQEGWGTPEQAGPPPAQEGWGTPEQAGPPPAQEGWGTPDQPVWPPPAQPGGGKRTMLVAAVGVGVFVALAVGASLVLRAGDEPEASAAPTPTSGTVVGAEALAVGDCLILPSEDQFDEVRKLGCTEPHDAEVFFVGDHPDGEYPTDDAFESFVRDQCLPVFETYTGSAFDDQEVLDVGWFTPTANAWDGGDRQVVCHLTLADESQSSQSWAGGNP